MFHSLTCKAVFWFSTWEKVCAANLALMSLSPCPLVNGITLGNSKSLQELNKIMLHRNLLISENYLGLRSSVGVLTLSDMGCTETFCLWASSSELHSGATAQADMSKASSQGASTHAPLAWNLSLLHMICGSAEEEVCCLMWHPGHPKPAFAMLCGTDIRPVFS